MKLFITLAVVGFLEYGYVINAAFVQVLVFIDIYRVDFDAYELEVLACKLASLTDVFDTAFSAAFAREQQDFFHATVGDDLHLVLNLFHVQLHTLNVIVAVETAIDAVVFAVVCNIERRKEIDVIAKMATRLNLCLGSHLFKERSCCRRKQSLEVFNRACVVLQGKLHIACGVLGSIIAIKCIENLVADVGVNHFHSRQVFHDVRTDRRICFNSVLAF